MTLSRRWAIAAGVGLLLAGSLWWLSRVGGRSQLHGEWSIGGDPVWRSVWTQQPRGALEALSTLLPAASNRDSLSGSVADDARGLARLAGVREGVALFDREGIGAVQARFTLIGTLTAKASGLLRGDAALTGGSVELFGAPGTVRWVRGEGRLATHWRWVRRDLGEPQRRVDARTQRTAEGSVIELLGVDPALERWRLGGQWTVKLEEPTSQQKQVDKVAVEFGRPSTQLVLRRPGAPVDAAHGNSTARPEEALQHFVAVLQTAGYSPLLVVGEQHENATQLLVWLQSAIQLDETTVRVEVPRAALLSSTSRSTWALPAEDAARGLQARFLTEELADGVFVRALGNEAFAAAVTLRDAFGGWVKTGGQQRILWVRPRAVAPWLEAMPRLRLERPSPLAERWREVLEQFDADETLVVLGERDSMLIQAP